MMNEDFRALLIADAGVSAVVADRVAWGVRPRGSALPSVVLNKIDGGHDYTLSTVSFPAKALIQVDCWGATYAIAKTAARAVVGLLSGYRGTIGGTDFGGVFLKAERDLPDETDVEDVLHRVSLDFDVWNSVAE